MSGTVSILWLSAAVSLISVPVMPGPLAVLYGMMCGYCPDISRTCYLSVWAGEGDQQGAREFGLSDTQVSPGVPMAVMDFALMVNFFFKFR